MGCPPQLLLGLQPRAGGLLAGGSPACPRVPVRSPARLLLFWVVVPTALPYTWHVEAIKTELRSRQSPRAVSCQAPRPGRHPCSPESVCVVTFQGWISTSADKKQERFCAKMKQICSCCRQRLRLPPPVWKLPWAVGMSTLPPRPRTGDLGA